MATWNPWVVTTRGRNELIKSAQDGRAINITRLKSSDADFSNINLASLEKLPNEKQSFSVLSITNASETQVKVEAIVNNVGVLKEYKVRALGIYATTGNNSMEYLLAVMTASEPDTVPVNANGVVKTITYRLLIALSNTANVGVKVDMNAYITRSMCIDISHPVGTILITDGSYNPADKFGGEWEKITGKYLMASGTYNGKTYKAGAVAGEAKHTISYGEMPMHSHTRGTMEIKGSFWADDSQYGGWYGPLEGAFRQGRKTGRGDLDSGGGGYDSGQIELIASRNWTGATSIEGEGKPMPLMPYCLVVDVWRRTA